MYVDKKIRSTNKHFFVLFSLSRSAVIYYVNFKLKISDSNFENDCRPRLEYLNMFKSVDCYDQSRAKGFKIGGALKSLTVFF